MNAQRFNRREPFPETGSPSRARSLGIFRWCIGKSIAAHSIPIAPDGRSGLVQYVLSFTGADFRSGVHAATPVRRTRNDKTLFIIMIWE